MVEQNHSKACDPTEKHNTAIFYNNVSKSRILMLKIDLTTYHTHKVFQIRDVSNRAYLSCNSLHNVKLFSFLPRFDFSN